MSSGKVVLGVLAGLATGAFLGILLAPCKGADTRRKMSKKGEDFVDVVKDKFNEFLDSLSEKFGEEEEAGEPAEPEHIVSEKI